jgi:hypothetical protein
MTALRAVKVADDFDERALVAQAQKLRTAFLECRLIGHAWKLSYIGPVAKSPDADIHERARQHPWKPDAVRALVCSRCRTKRIDLCMLGYGRNAYAYRLVARSYAYHDDYKLEGAQSHRELLHEELFRRAEAGEKL